MKEWYLIESSGTNLIGGYENMGFNDYKDDALLESLKTDMADDVLLYSHDLTSKKKIRCIIQDNTADTQLKSMERTILVPIGTLHAGDYIFFQDIYWIINGMPGNNKIYEKATMKLCQYKLRWQKENGRIVERWCNLTSASKYDIGESGNNTIILSTNNYTILIPHDEDGETVDGKRVFIDTSNNPRKVFKITRNDDPLYFYGSHGGLLSLIADKTELNLEKDRIDLRLCDYIKPLSPTLPYSNKIEDLFAVISGHKNVKIGYPRKYTVLFSDAKTKEPISWNEIGFKWNISSSFPVEYDITENTIKLSVDDESLIGSSFLLQVKIDETMIAQMTLFVEENF